MNKRIANIPLPQIVSADIADAVEKAMTNDGDKCPHCKRNMMMMIKRCNFCGHIEQVSKGE